MSPSCCFTFLSCWENFKGNFFWSKKKYYDRQLEFLNPVTIGEVSAQLAVVKEDSTQNTTAILTNQSKSSLGITNESQIYQLTSSNRPSIGIGKVSYKLEIEGDTSPHKPYPKNQITDNALSIDETGIVVKGNNTSSQVNSNIAKETNESIVLSTPIFQQLIPNDTLKEITKTARRLVESTNIKSRPDNSSQRSHAQENNSLSTTSLVFRHAPPQTTEIPQTKPTLPLKKNDKISNRIVSERIVSERIRKFEELVNLTH